MVDKSRVFLPGDSLNAETVNWLNDTLLTPNPPTSLELQNLETGPIYEISAKALEDIPPYGICIPYGHEQVKIYDGSDYPYMLVADAYGAKAGGWGMFSPALEPVPIWLDYDSIENDSDIQFTNLLNTTGYTQFPFGPAVGSCKATKGNNPFHILCLKDKRGPNESILAVQRFQQWEYATTKTMDWTTPTPGAQKDVYIDISDIKIAGTYQVGVTTVVRYADTVFNGEPPNTQVYIKWGTPDSMKGDTALFSSAVYLINYEQSTKLLTPASTFALLLVNLKPGDSFIVVLPEKGSNQLKSEYKCQLSFKRIGIYGL